MNTKVIFMRGNSQFVDSLPIKDGQFICNTENGEVSFDIDNRREKAQHISAICQAANSYSTTQCEDYCKRERNVSWGNNEIINGNIVKQHGWRKNNIIILIVPCTNGTKYISYQKVIDSNNLLPLKIYWIQPAPPSSGGGGKGEDGGYYTPSVSAGGTLTWSPSKTSMPSVPSSEIKGPAGKTPQKGIDYFTTQDKKELVQQVINELPKWEGGTY